MGFQQPPSLPDYSKLLLTLNNSGMQKVDPPIYEILSKLIQAVQQSQDVITNNVTNIVNPPSTVIVDPAGAILGDGSVTTPLRVSVDGVSILIVGNQLVGVAGTGIPIQEVQGSFTTNDLLNLNTVPRSIIGSPGVGFFNQVLWWKSHFYSDPATPQQFNFSQNAKLLYNDGTLSANAIMNIPSLTVGSVSVDSWSEGAIPGLIYPIPGLPENAAVYIQAGIDNSLKFAGGSNLHVRYSMGYCVLVSL